MVEFTGLICHVAGISGDTEGLTQRGPQSKTLELRVAAAGRSPSAPGTRSGRGSPAARAVAVAQPAGGPAELEEAVVLLAIDQARPQAPPRSGRPCSGMPAGLPRPGRWQ